MQDSRCRSRARGARTSHRLDSQQVAPEAHRSRPTYHTRFTRVARARFAAGRHHRRKLPVSAPNAEGVCDLDDLALSLSALGIQTVPRAELARQSHARVTGQRQSHRTTPESRQSHATTPESRQSHATTPESRDNARVTLKQCRTAMSRAMLASRGASKAGTLSRAELSQATSCLRG